MAVISQQSIMENAFRVAASTAQDPNTSPIIDAEYLTEDQFRDALRAAVIEQNFQRSYELSLTDGKVILPPGIILEKLNTATVYSDDNFDEQCSFEERLIDYNNFIYGDNLSRFTVNNNAFLYTGVGGDVNTFGGNITATLTALPDIPDDITEAIDIPDTLADRTSELLANKLRGQ